MQTPTLKQMATALNEAFGGEPNRLARVLTGPRCEQWLNAESRVAVQWSVHCAFEALDALDAEIYSSKNGRCDVH